jgi:hypothetical protein
MDVPKLLEAASLLVPRETAASGPISPSVRLPKPDGRRPSPVPASRDRCGTSETEPRPANQCSTSRASGWSSCPSWSPVGEPRCDSLRSMLRGGDAFGPAKSARPSTGWGPGRSLRAGHAASRRRPRGGLLPRVSRPDLGPSQGRVRVTSSRRPGGPCRAPARSPRDPHRAAAGHQPVPAACIARRPHLNQRLTSELARTHTEVTLLKERQPYVPGPGPCPQP